MMHSKKEAPTISTDALSVLQIEDVDALTARYAQLFNRWNNNFFKKNFTELGQFTSTVVYESSYNPVYLAILGNDLRYVKNYVESNELQRHKIHKLLSVSRVFGSKEIGEWLINELSIDLQSLSDAESYAHFSELGASNNKEWLIESLEKSGLKAFPAATYSALDYTGTKILNEINEARGICLPIELK
jgi:hypothetical protein